MLKTVQTFLILLCFTILYSCSEKPNKQIHISSDIQFIGHKGSGPIDETGNINLLENTWDAIANAMNNLDGSEIDIQMSADSTLWVFHNHEIIDCKDSSINFFLFTDAEILEISKCNYKNSLIQFSEFLAKSKAQDWDNKILSLDLKMLFNPEIKLNFKSQEQLLSFLGEKLQHLLKNCPFDVLFEVFTDDEYAYFDRLFKGKVYMVNNSPNLELVQEMNEKKVNLSCPIYELDDSLSKSGIHIQNLWTINNANQFIKSLPFKPQVLESDNIPLMTFFKAIQNGRALKCTSSGEYHIQLKDEAFYSIKSVDLPASHNVLFQFETIQGTFPEDVFITFTAFSEDGDNKKWTGLKFSESPDGYYFMDADYLRYLGASMIKISIWNKEIRDLDCKLRLSQFILD